MSFIKPLAPLTSVARMRPLADNINYVTIASGSNTANTRTLFKSPKNSAITDIVIGLPGFYNGQPEANMPIGCTFTAALEYPIGTRIQCFSADASTLTVTPGRGIFLFDPLPIHIPKDTSFAVTLYIAWTGGSVNFPLNSSVHGAYGEWTDAGVDLTDKTLNTATQAHDYAAPAQLRGLGIAPIVYGRMRNPSAVLGILGDSISQGMGDTPDGTSGALAWERGMRNEIPTINVARQAEMFSNFLSRRDGRMTLLRDSITHLLVAYGRNDASNGVAAATQWTSLQTIIELFTSQGVKVYANTVTPVTTSTDTWATRDGQTSTGNDSIACTYNDLLRTRWKEIGLTGIFDVRKVVDPTDSGIWNVDHGHAGQYAYGVATIVDNKIDRVELPVLSAGTAYGGASYAASQTALECIVHAQPDDPIPGGAGGGRVVAITDGSGVVTGYRVLDRGRYSLAPYIAPVGRWVSDGTHMSVRGYNEVLAKAGFCASRFILD